MNRFIFTLSALLLLATVPDAAFAACVTQAISLGETKSATLTADDCIDHNANGYDYYYDYYRFSASSGKQIAISNSSTSIDPDLMLIFPDGSNLYNDDSGTGTTNARIPVSGNLTLTQSGNYAIIASSALSLQTGSYTLTLAVASSTPQPPAGCSIVAAPASASGSPLQPGTAVQLTANCSSGTQPITYTWDSGAFSGAVRSVAPTATTTYSVIASNAGGAAAAISIMVFVSAPAATGKPTIEFYNVNLKHYFVTAEQAEATAIDNGSAGAGWVRTGFSYNVYSGAQISEVKAATANPVCRFYGTPGVGPNSHFYTVDAAECAAVKRDPGWTYEGIAYYIQPPQFGSCPTGTQPIYRVYNNRAQQNDSNHRFTTNPATYQQMGDQGWSMEGVVMCTTGVRSPTPVTGGNFKDSSGATVSVAPGEIPGYINATAPTLSGAPALPPGLNVNPQTGDVNVTRSPTGYDFHLTGDGGFTTNTAGAITIALPYDLAAIPVVDRTDPVKTFTRIFNWEDNSIEELTGDIAIAGSSGMLTVETRGLPKDFTAIVVYNPNMNSVPSEEAIVSLAPSPGPRSNLKTATTAWPAQAYCIIYNSANPNLIAAVKNLHGLTANPGAALIRGDVVNLVGGSARKAQAIYQTDGLIGPNLYIGRTACRDNVARYSIHMADDPLGSNFSPDNPNEWENPLTINRHFGRLIIENSWLDGHVASMLDIVSHEMLHGVQDSYQIWGITPKGYREGSAATYGRSIDKGQVIAVRGETFSLAHSLMSSVAGQRYDNEDFFAYVGKLYNGGSLNYMAGIYAQMYASIGPGVNDPAAATMYSAMDIYLNGRFSQSLQSVYLDFLKQRALTHNAASQFGRAGEVVSGLAEPLFGTEIVKQAVSLSTCSAQKITKTISGIGSFAARAIVLTPTGTLPAGKTEQTLAIKITPASSSVGALWNGYTFRTNTAGSLAANNKFTGFGKVANEQIVIVVANLNPAAAGAFDLEIGCAGVAIDSISPVKGPVGTVVTINGSGFGTSADTRSVTFNGVAATAVTFSSDTRATATVPANASTGDVVVTVNGENSNGVNFEVTAQCSTAQTAGGDVPDTRTIDLGKSGGTFVFTYDTQSVKDQMIVRYQGTTLFDSGCVGTNGDKTVPLTYGGTSTQITVQVVPNCEGGSGTAWSYSVSCP